MHEAATAPTGSLPLLVIGITWPWRPASAMLAVPGRVYVTGGNVPKAFTVTSLESEIGVSGMTICTVLLCSPWAEVTVVTAAPLPSMLVAPDAPMAMPKRAELAVAVAVISTGDVGTPIVAELGASSCTTAVMGTSP